MKRLSLVAFLALLTFVCHAQKVDLDKFNFTFEYRDLPTSPLNPEFKTFSVNFNMSSMMQNNFGGSSLNDMLNIDGWKKVTGAPGHIVATISFDDLVITSSKVTERVEEQKDKDGKVTSRKYYYKAEATYSFKGKVNVKDHKETQIASIFVGNASDESWASSEYGSRKEANDYLAYNYDAIRNQLIRKEVTESMNELSYSLSDSYGYQTIKENEILWLLDSKKHPETITQKEAWDKFKPAVAAINANELPASTKQTFEELLKYFDSIVAKYPADEKADKKMRYGSYYNKAKIYMYLDQPEAAIKECDALIANDYDPGDGKRIKKEAEALIESLKKNNTTSRHFPIDLSAVQPPAAN
jgi:hypothetical protein